MSEKSNTYYTDKLKKFYFNDWIIAVLIALWILVVPAIAGIALLILKTIYTSKSKIEYQKILEQASKYDELVQTISDQKEKIESMEPLLSEDAKDIAKLNDKKMALNKEIKNLDSILNNKKDEQKNIEDQLSAIKEKIKEKESKLLTLDDDILVQDFGIYKPLFDFANSSKYKDKLTEIRNQQKACIKNKSAATGSKDWSVNGDKRKGSKMVSDMQKLLIRAFNSECDELVNKVKYNNVDAILKRMTSSRDAISKLGTIMNVSITDKYFNLKVEELHLALEYAIVKNDEKEAAREARAQQREAERLEREIAEQRKKAEKEQEHYQNALDSILKQIKENSEPSQDLLDKKAELEAQLGKIDKAMKDLDYREANQRAGYVYVISNIGAFGEDVYKIGMTRRLNPQERVDELGDASVPFNFDVHAMIFSDDAPALENALHKAFENKKVNMVNQRREFFHVTLDEIKKVINDNFDKTVEFKDVPDAEQYRITQTMLSH